jgi:hypothetical protein
MYICMYVVVAGCLLPYLLKLKLAMPFKSVIHNSNAMIFLKMFLMFLFQHVMSQVRWYVHCQNRTNTYVHIYIPMLKIR